MYICLRFLFQYESAEKKYREKDSPYKRPSQMRTGVKLSCGDLDDTAGLLDLFLCLLADVSGLDDEGSVAWNAALGKHFAVAGGDGVDDGDEVTRGGSLVFWQEGNELVGVNDRAPVVVAEEVEVSHTNFAEVTQICGMRASLASLSLRSCSHCNTRYLSKLVLWWC